MTVLCFLGGWGGRTSLQFINSSGKNSYSESLKKKWTLLPATAVWDQEAREVWLASWFISDGFFLPLLWSFSHLSWSFRTSKIVVLSAGPWLVRCVYANKAVSKANQGTAIKKVFWILWHLSSFFICMVSLTKCSLRMSPVIHFSYV